MFFLSKCRTHTCIYIYTYILSLQCRPIVIIRKLEHSENSARKPHITLHIKKYKYGNFLIIIDIFTLTSFYLLLSLAHILSFLFINASIRTICVYVCIFSHKWPYKTWWKIIIIKKKGLFSYKIKVGQFN